MSPVSSTSDRRALFDSGAVRCVGIFPALHKRRIGLAVRELAEWLGERGLRVLLPQEQAEALSLPEFSSAPEELAAAADLLIAMGGDGTLLATARVGAPRGKPILGINFGGFGFLAAIPKEDMLAALAAVMEGEVRVQKRMMLSARVLRRKKVVGEFLALNDVVVGKGAFSRLFRLKTSISGEPVSDFPADGMIVSTPTGSTGYSLSAGGPVLDPEVRAIIVTPICAHALSARSLVVPVGRVIEISLPDPRGEEVTLTADGQEGFDLQARDCVEIGEADCSARLVSLLDASFYRKIRSKLGWGGQR